jgi:flagellar hook-associated protein 2
MVGNGFSADGQNASELLAAAYRRTRQPAVDAMQASQSKLTQRQMFFNSLRTKLETLQSTASSFTDSGSSSKFSTRKATVSDATVASASVTADAVSGSSTLKVSRLASNDTLVTDSGLLAKKFNDNFLLGTTPPATGTQSFTIGGRSYSIAYDSVSDTNETVMTKIAAAINADSAATVSANFMKDTSTTGRMSFVSKSTGEAGAVTFDASSDMLKGLGLGSVTQQTSAAYAAATGIYLQRNDFTTLPTGVYSFKINGVAASVTVGIFQRNSSLQDEVVSAIQNASIPAISSSIQVDGPNSRLLVNNVLPGGSLSITDTNGLLSYLGIPTQEQTAERTKSTSSKAGYASGSESSLNSMATVNGVSVSRSTNTLTDVLPGMTINLLKAQGASDSAVSLTVAKDTDAITASLQPMVDGFNDALRYIQGNLRTAAGNDSSVRSLQSQMRSLSTKMFGGSGDSLKYLTDIGFKIEKDGTLAISDKEKLKSAIQTDSTLLEKIFSGAEGLASSVQSTISGFVGTEGLAGLRSKTLGTQIAASTEKINKLKARIEKEVEQQVKDYRKLQESFYKMQGQMSKYSSFSYQQ